MTRHNTSKQLSSWDHAFLWHPFTQMQEWVQEHPVMITRGKGSYLIDLQGRCYLDGVSSMWVNVHGHNHPRLNRAITKQLKSIAHSTLLGLSHPPAVRLARELVKIAPPGLTRVFFSDDGSTAVEVALKMAVQYWQQKMPGAGGKTKFLRLRHAYHGDTLGAVSVGQIELFHARFESLLFPTITAEPPYCYRCPIKMSYPSCHLSCLKPIEDLLRAHHAELAGFIIEPLVQAAAGMITSPAGYLEQIRDLCTTYRVLLIADEVATGFGRTGRMFACEHERVSPDLITLSKGLTGGYLPLAATLTTEEVYDAFLGTYGEWKTFFHGHSYTGNPLGCAAALANLEIFKRERTLAKLPTKIAALRKLLQPIAALPHVGDIRHRGYMVGIELVSSRATREPYPLEARMGHRVSLEARRRGLIIRPLGNVVVLMPPLSTSLRELTRMTTIIRDSIQTATMT